MTTSPVMSISDELLAELERDLDAYDSLTGPVKGINGNAIRAILAEREQLKRELAKIKETLSLWEPIMDEVDRRADKEWCIQSKCDFTVTVFYEDYVKIDAAMQS